MEDHLARDLYASQVGALSVSVGILRALVAKGLLQPSEAAGIVRDAATNLPDAAEDAWKAVQHQMYDAIADRLETDREARAAA